MKIIIVFAMFLCAFFVCESFAVPIDTADANIDESNAPNEVAEELQQQQTEHSRHKRATCDLFSAADVKHTACAAHCLLRGKRGGYCNGKAVCVCR